MVVLTIALSLAVAALLMMTDARQRVRNASMSAGVTLGNAVRVINNAVGTWQATFADYIIANDSASVGVPDVMHPTVADLKAKGMLSATYNAVAPGGGQFLSALAVEPAGCTGADCNITSSTWLSQPMLRSDSGKIDVRRLAAAVNAIGGDGGFADDRAPATVRGSGGWTKDNPDAGKRAGILLAVNGYGSSAWGAFVRIRDTRDPDLRGKLTVAGDTALNSNLTVAGTATTKDAVVNNDLYMPAVGLPGAACAQNLSVRRSNATGTGLVICAFGRWQPIGTTVNNVSEGTACATPDQLATNTANQGFICRNGVYVSINNLMPKNVDMARYVVGDNNVAVPKPACSPGGSPSFSFEARTMGTDFSSAPPYTAVRYSADDYGWAWVPRILLVNMNGSLASGNNIGLQGVFKAECYYP
ncbi:hypothetical protein ACU4GI_33230 [Cupriavidus basilensis]